MFSYHHTAIVGSTARVPFECDACHAQAIAIVTVKSAGFAKSSYRDDARAAQAATEQAQRGIERAVPRLAGLAPCPSCGYRSAEALAGAKSRGIKLALGGLAALTAGILSGLLIGGATGWIVGGVAILFGVILAPVGLIMQRLSVAASDQAVRFEPAPQERTASS